MLCTYTIAITFGRLFRSGYGFEIAQHEHDTPLDFLALALTETWVSK